MDQWFLLAIAYFLLVGLTGYVLTVIIYLACSSAIKDYFEELEDK